MYPSPSSGPVTYVVSLPTVNFGFRPFAPSPFLSSPSASASGVPGLWYGGRRAGGEALQPAVAMTPRARMEVRIVFMVRCPVRWEPEVCLYQTRTGESRQAPAGFRAPPVPSPISHSMGISSGTSPASRSRGRSLERLEVLPEHGGGDLQLEDLVGPLVDAADAHVHQVPADAVQGRPPAPPVDLYRPVGGVPCRVGREQLRLRRQEVRLRLHLRRRRRLGGVLRLGGPHQHRLGRGAVQLDRGDVLLHQLVLADELAVLLPLLRRVADHLLQAVLDDAETPRRDADAPADER